MANQNSVNTPNPVGQSGSQIYAASATGNDTYAITLSPVPLAYATGMMLNVQPDFTNIGPSTLNVNALGVKAIVRSDGTPTQSGDITSGRIVTVIYDSVSFQIVSGSGGGASASDFTQVFLLGGM